MLLSSIFDYKIPKVVIIHSIPCKIQFKQGINYKPKEQNRSYIADDADYVIHSQEKDAIFIMTNSIETDQEYKQYPDMLRAPYMRGAFCLNNSQCQSNLASEGLCEIEGWCPIMNDLNIPNPLKDVLNFRLFIRNRIMFKKYYVIRSNIIFDIPCNYDPKNDRICPIFRIGTILDIVEPDQSEQRKMLTYGGVIHIHIDWRYTQSYEEGPLPGYNFRYASHWKHENRSFRTLTKAFGLHFIVTGHAGRFSLAVLIINIIFIIAVICLITFIFDMIGLHISYRSAVDRSQ
ncbi:unnamed protein product [Adineta steineri]|uniref:Purinergic receptor n=1 Tax=Adineta steineri TaxID=433720 RepID=A0A815ZQW1_9BILA|nr:unnamed protein product [Adineta steineri]CAF1338108.1 unnamed protein product [Adineta steineri]CAF1587908.1 unnamed protein product [Adineta steineri]CAF1591877.1 unnamed protein product [Adineta steineri]